MKLRNRGASITLSVVITSRGQVTVMVRRIEDAFKRNADLEAKGVQVSALDGKVTLEGRAGRR